MGIYIHLIVNETGISKKKWEEVYNESCILLQRFPLQLMRLEKENYDDYLQRLVKTPDIFCQQATPEEHWKLYGDMLSGRSAEIFVLYKNLQSNISPHTRYRIDKIDKKDKKEAKMDVLWANVDNINAISSCGKNIFGNKTQGYPYHLALLAVAILVENRLPKQAYMLGDIDELQVKTITQWINNTLDKPVNIPVCCNPSELYKRLDALYDDKKLLLERFDTIFRGSDEEKNSFLYQNMKDTFLEKVKERLSDYNEPKQFGAIAILFQLAYVTHDLRYLIEVSKEISTKNKKFTLTALLQMLCNHFITIEVAEREPLSVYVKSMESINTIEDTFAQIFSKLSGAPSAIDFYVSGKELLDIFSSFEPKKRKDFEKIIAESEKNCKKIIEGTLEAIKSMEGKKSSKTKYQPDSYESPASARDGVIQTQTISPEESYILKQAYIQKQDLDVPEEIIKMFNIKLIQAIKGAPDLFDKNRKELLKLLVSASFENGFSLKKSAWQRIDNEQNSEILKKLAALAAITEREITFWHFRIFILENDHLWPLLTDSAAIAYQTVKKNGKKRKKLKK